VLLAEAGKQDKDVATEPESMVVRFPPRDSGARNAAPSNSGSKRDKPSPDGNPGVLRDISAALEKRFGLKWKAEEGRFPLVRRA
jgi:hypothetical protein